MGLREVRKQRGLTIEHIAVLGGCDKATVSRWERGLQEPRPELVVRVSRALKVKPGRITE
jgi:transcriptional regulator with XRE-family HTH domain